jgi:hypothetical protein
MDREANGCTVDVRAFGFASVEVASHAGPTVWASIRVGVSSGGAAGPHPYLRRPFAPLPGFSHFHSRASGATCSLKRPNEFPRDLMSRGYANLALAPSDSPAGSRPEGAEAKPLDRSDSAKGVQHDDRPMSVDDVPGPCSLLTPLTRPMIHASD